MLHNILNLIVSSIAGVFAGFLLLRFWMQVQRVRPPAQLAQAIFQLTDWIVHPIRRIVPGYRGYDWASLIAVLLVALLTVSITRWNLLMISPVQLIVYGLIQLAQWILYSLFMLLILEVVFSWVNPHAPVAPFVRALNEPLLSPIRRVVPAIGGIDFSPMLLLLLLNTINMVLAGF